MSTRNREETQAILDTADLLFSEAQCDEALERMAAEITQDMSDSYPFGLACDGRCGGVHRQIIAFVALPFGFRLRARFSLWRQIGRR